MLVRGTPLETSPTIVQRPDGAGAGRIVLLLRYGRQRAENGWNDWPTQWEKKRPCRRRDSCSNPSYLNTPNSGVDRRTPLPIHPDGRARIGGSTRKPLPQALLAALLRRLGDLAELRDASAGRRSANKGDLRGNTRGHGLPWPIRLRCLCGVRPVLASRLRQGGLRASAETPGRGPRVRVVVAEMDTRNAASVSLVAEALASSGSVRRWAPTTSRAR